MLFSAEGLEGRRRAAGLSRPDVVAAFIEHGARVSEKTVLRWEAGTAQPRADQLALLAAVLGCSVQDFFELVEEPVKEGAAA